MFYISAAGLIARRGEAELVSLSDQDPDSDIDYAPVNAAIRDAEGEINSYIGVRYDLPLPGVTDIDTPEDNTAVPAVLRRVAIDITVYRLAVDYGGTLTDEKRRRYDDALNWLKAVAAGQSVLGSDDEPAPAGGTSVRFSANERLFTRCLTRGL